MVLEGTFSIAPDLYCNPVKLDHVLVDTLTILHGQVVKLMLCISNRVVQTKVHLEHQNKLLVVLLPGWIELEVIHKEEVWFKPLQDEVGLHEGDFGVVLSEYLRVVMEIEITLRQEDPEFVGISPIKLVQFSDFDAL